MTVSRTAPSSVQQSITVPPEPRATATVPVALLESGHSKESPSATQLTRQAARQRANFARFSLPTGNPLPTIHEALEPAQFPKRDAFKDLSPLSGDLYRQAIANLISRHTGLDPDFSCMTAEQGKIFFEELAKNASGHLQEVKLLPRCVDVPVGDMANALRRLAHNHPQAQIDLNFCGRKLNAEEGELLADTLVNSNVSTLLLDSHPPGISDGTKAILEAVPQSKVTQLEVIGKGVERCADAIAKAVPQLKKLELSSIGISEDAQERRTINDACIDSGKPHIANWHHAGVEIVETRKAITEHAASLEPEQFREGVAALIKANKNIQVDFWELEQLHADKKMEIILEELQKGDVTNLRIVGFQLWELEKIPAGTLDATIAMSQNNPELRMSMVFDDTYLGTDGAKVIAEGLPQIKVAALQLRDTSLGAEGTTAIANAVRHSEVQDLNMCNNEFNDQGVTALATALSGLQLLTLTAANFTDAQRRTLDAAHANCDKNKTALTWK